MSDIIVCLVIIAASIFFYIYTLTFPVILKYEKMGPGFWPKLVLTGIVLAAVSLLIESIRKRRDTVQNKKPVDEEKNTKLVVVCAVILVVFLYLMQIVGFVLSSFFATAILAYILGERKKRTTVIYSFIIVLVIYASFAKLMYVPLPRGVSVFRELSYYLY
jgi:hypothetical protein